MTTLTRTRSRRGPASRALSSIVLSLVVLVVGWSALWLVARRQAEHSFDAWIATEEAAGRLWSCPGRAIGGFPLEIKLSCETPSFAEARNPGFQGRLAAIKAKAHLYFPTSVAIDLTGPLTIQDHGIDSGLQVIWEAARVVLRGNLPGNLDRGHLEARDVVVAAPGRAPLRVASATVGFEPVAVQSAELTAELAGLQDPEADTVFGSAEPFAVGLKATLTGLPQRGASLPTLLEAWRQAGGTLDVVHLAVVKGSFSARGNGELRIDDAHRIAGRVQAHFTGLEPLAGRFGIPVAAVKVGGLLSSLLGGKPAASPEPQSAALDLPIVLRDGRLFIGPAKTGLVLPPLY